MDPTTIEAALSAALAFFKQQQQSDWQASVSAQLAAIAAALDQIFNYLKQLPQIISKALDDAQAKVWQDQMQSYVTDVNQYLKDHPHGPPDGQGATDWHNKFLDLKDLTQENYNYPLYGFTQFPVVALGVSAAAGLVKFLSKDRQAFSDLVAAVLVYFRAAVDPTVSNSLASALAAQIAARNSISSTYDPLFNVPWWTGLAGGESGGGGGRGGVRIVVPHTGIAYTYTVAGSVETGVGSVKHAAEPDFEGAFMPTTSGPNAEQDGIAYLNQGVAMYKSAVSLVAEAQACVDACNKIIAQLEAVGNSARKSHA